jgi:hypothetical protein
MTRLYGSLLLSLCLLFAQQGALRHEISHLVRPPEKSQKEKPGAPEPCGLCLAFGHLATMAKTEIYAPTLLPELAFHHALERPLADAEAASISPRSRGPPVS